MCWPHMKMERKNDYKNTPPTHPFSGHFLAMERATHKQLETEKPMLYGDRFQLKTISLIPALPNIHEDM